MNKKSDAVLGLFFALATVVFLIVFLTNEPFFNWAFERHHNILSWYIRPIFIIPIVLFAYRRSWTGIFASVFALFTSMFWFPAPETSSADVLSFLAYEIEYLKGAWDGTKIFMSLTVPVFFIILILAAWQRNGKWLIGIVIGAALLKIMWSIIFSGDAGMSVIKPAITGVVVCILGIFFYKRRLSMRK